MADERGGGLIQRIRILLDEAAKREFVDETQAALKDGTDPKAATANAGRLAGVWDGLKGRALALGAAIAGALAVGAMIHWGKEAVGAALEARAPWARLGVVLGNVGVRLEDVQADIDQVAASVEKMNVDDEQAASILADLVTFSGNYAESLKNVQLVADLAAAKQMDLGSAADLVGKIMSGNTEIAQRYLGKVAEGTDVLELMRQKFSGAAEAISAQRGGLDQVNIAWGNFQEAVGEAILASGKGSNMMDTLRAIIVTLTKTVQENQDGIAALGKILLWLVRIPAAMVMGFLSGFVQVARLATMAYAGLVVGARAFANAIGIATPGMDAHLAQLEKYIDAMTEAAETANKLAQAIAWDTANPGAGKTRPPGAGGGGGVTPPTTAPGAAGAGAGAPTGDPEADRIRLLLQATEFSRTRAEAIAELKDKETELKDRLAEGNLTLEERVALEEKLADVRRGLGKDTADAVGFMNATIDDAFTKLAEGAQGPLQALGMIVEGVGQVDNAMQLVGKGAWKQIAENLKKEAKGEAIKAAAHALTQVAFGIARAAIGDGAGAAAHFTAAKVFTLSALKWAAIAGGAGIAAGGGSGGGSGGTGSAGGAGTDQARDAEKRGPDIYLTVDGVDPGNPRHHELIGETNRQYQERTGGTIHYAGTSGGR